MHAVAQAFKPTAVTAERLQCADVIGAMFGLAHASKRPLGYDFTASEIRSRHLLIQKKAESIPGGNSITGLLKGLETPHTKVRQAGPFLDRLNAIVQRQRRFVDAGAGSQGGVPPEVCALAAEWRGREADLLEKEEEAARNRAAGRKDTSGLGRAPPGHVLTGAPPAAAGPLPLFV